MPSADAPGKALLPEVLGADGTDGAPDPVDRDAEAQASIGDAETIDPPVAQTPGVRAAKFVELYERTLAKTLSVVTYRNLASCFPTVAETAPDSLQQLHQNFADKLAQFARSDFDKIMEERSVVQNLNALEDLIAAAQRRRARHVDSEPVPSPPHLLSAAAVMAGHLAPQQAQQQSMLNARLQTTQSQNAILAETIRKQREEIASLAGGFEGYVRDLEGAVESLERLDDAFRRETRTINEAVAAT